MAASSHPQVAGLVDHLFRHRSGQLVAILTRIFGPRRIELAEDVAQEALVKALRLWPFQGIPDNPSAWIIEVAKNLALDHLRRDASLRDKEPELRRWAQRHQQEPKEGVSLPFVDELQDDQLRLIFVCCHEAIPHESRIALTLKTLGGFGVAEIARAFLTQEATIAQRLVRAKHKIREANVAFVFPPPGELPNRLDSVLEVLYLMFNEGHTAYHGENLVRHDLIAEAIRLTALLLEPPATCGPRVHALMALMLFQASRLPARLDRDGNLLLLAEQDRSLWDRSLIQRGFHHLRQAGRGNELSAFHIEAGIASCHALAPSVATTDWPAILRWYDLLMRVRPSPVVSLNRAVAVAMVHGNEAGLRELDLLMDARALQNYYLLSATRGEFLRQLGETHQAAECFRQALSMNCSEPERRFLLGRLRECAQDSDMTSGRET